MWYILGEDTMGKKTFSIIAAGIFLMSALFICPCPVTAFEEPVRITKSHSCCPQEAAAQHCPESQCEHKQIKNPISTGSASIEAPTVFPSLSLSPLMVTVTFKGDCHHLLRSFEMTSDAAPPDLVIQYSSLLI